MKKKVSTSKWDKVRIGRASNPVADLYVSAKELSWIEEWMRKTGRATFPLAIREMIHVAAASRRLVKKKETK